MLNTFTYQIQHLPQPLPPDSEEDDSDSVSCSSLGLTSGDVGELLGPRPESPYSETDSLRLAVSGFGSRALSPNSSFSLDSDNDSGDSLASLKLSVFDPADPELTSRWLQEMYKTKRNDPPQEGPQEPQRKVAIDHERQKDSGFYSKNDSDTPSAITKSTLGSIKQSEMTAETTSAVLHTRINAPLANNDLTSQSHTLTPATKSAIRKENIKGQVTNLDAAMADPVLPPSVGTADHAPAPVAPPRPKRRASNAGSTSGAPSDKRSKNYVTSVQAEEDPVSNFPLRIVVSVGLYCFLVLIDTFLLSIHSAKSISSCTYMVCIVPWSLAVIAEGCTASLKVGIHYQTTAPAFQRCQPGCPPVSLFLLPPVFEGHRPLPPKIKHSQ